MNPRLLCSLFLLLSGLVSLTAQQQSEDPFGPIARLEDAAERETALREKLSQVESLEGRLLLLEDAAGVPSLEESSRRIRLELLLLAGRTGEAEALLETENPDDTGLRLRLEITHGNRALPPAPGAIAASYPELSVPDRQTIDERSGREGVTPENLAVRRGMLISTGILFSPYSFPEKAEEEADDKEEGKQPQGKTLAIQVGAFSREANAISHLEFLTERGVRATIQRIENADSSTIYKTVISDIPADTIQHELIRLKEKGIEGFILR